MPFSNMQTAFTVDRRRAAPTTPTARGTRSASRPRSARDARIFTTCADCGGALERKVAAGAITETRGVVHFALPARRWWDDVGFT